MPLVTFIHFYAGHDPYLEMIPEAYRASIDSKLEDSANPEALLGKVYNGQYRIKEWNDYDTAVRYVDAGIDALIEDVSQKERASIVLFFSGHGEAPMAGRRHDSSQYVLD
ncbi:MAG: arylsulfatase A-like enzyme, partial [Candidatus Azotimanducaceae bacterium]